MCKKLFHLCATYFLRDVTLMCHIEILHGFTMTKEILRIVTILHYQELSSTIVSVLQKSSFIFSGL